MTQISLYVVFARVSCLCKDVGNFILRQEEQEEEFLQQKAALGQVEGAE